MSAFLETFSFLGAIIISVSDPFPYYRVVKFTIAFRVWLLHFQNDNVGLDVVFIGTEKKKKRKNNDEIAADILKFFFENYLTKVATLSKEMARKDWNNTRAIMTTLKLRFLSNRYIKLNYFPFQRRVAALESVRLIYIV